VTWWLGLLPRARDPEHYELSAEYLSRIWKATGADEPATALASARAPGVYVYRFDWDEEPTVLFVSDLSQLLGAAHAFEIPFVFGHWNLGPEGERIFSAANRPGRETLSEQMSSYWAEFAAAGAPDRGRDGSLPEWTAWSGASPRFLVFDTPEDGGLRMESGALTEAGVLRAVDEDPRLPTQRDRCRIFRELADWGRSLTRESYVNAGRLGCADYPFDAYPWGG
jgi:para-nitrobenzyl esterase